MLNWALGLFELKASRLEAQPSMRDGGILAPKNLTVLRENRMPIDRLVQEERGYILRLLLVVGSPDNLFAIVKTVFELAIELCINDENEYRH